MAAHRTRHLPISRRAVLAFPLTTVIHSGRLDIAAGQAGSVDREPIATVERTDGLTPPLTLGMARVVLRPGATAWAATPDGARMIAVEAGVLAVAATSPAEHRLSAAEFAISAPEPNLTDELFVPAGTTIAFGAHAVAAVRNPGSRSVVALDVAVYHEEPRPIARAFTTEDGVSFQLLASASAAAAPAGRVIVSLERVQLGARSVLPGDLSAGLTLIHLRAGIIEVRPVSGDVYAARAAAAAPYSMPGALQAIPMRERREVTAGGVAFLPQGAAADVANVSARPADLLTLAVRETS